MKIRYTSEASLEIDRILAIIADISPSGARNVRKRIREIARMLADKPKSGRQTDIPNLRRIGVNPYPYIVFYQVVGSHVLIVGVRHGARDPDTMPDAL